MNATVDQNRLPLRSEETDQGVPPRRTSEPAVVVESDVTEHQDDLVAERLWLGRVFHDERAVQPLRHLHRRIDVRVVPEETRIGDVKVVVEGLARQHRILAHRCPVHVHGDAHAVPVDRGRLGEAIFEVRDHAVTDFRANERTG